MQPRFTIHASPAASSTISSAARPDGNDRVTVRSHWGAYPARAFPEGLAFRAVLAFSTIRAVADRAAAAATDR
jgi:hypothetical protein